MSDFEALIDAVKQGAPERVEAILRSHPQFINRRDVSGATLLHYAAFAGHRTIVELLVQHGADINARDAQFNATPTGWAIEYMRELGGLLGIELDDFAYAIEDGDLKWAARFLKRFPALRHAADHEGVPFRQLAKRSGNPEIVSLFDSARGD